MKADIHERIRTTAESIARSAGASAEVQIDAGCKVTVNDEKLTARMLPTLQKVAGAANVALAPKLTGAEDFSAYQQVVPGLFIFIGVTSKGADVTKAAPNHSPRFFMDEAGLLTGVRALAQLTLDYMTGSDK